MKLSPRDTRILYELANVQQLAGDRDSAITTYYRGLEVSPDHVGVRASLGLALLGAGRPDEALATLEAALDRDPDNAEIKRLIDSIVDKSS